MTYKNKWVCNNTWGRKKFDKVPLSNVRENSNKNFKKGSEYKRKKKWQLKIRWENYLQKLSLLVFSTVGSDHDTYIHIPTYIFFHHHTHTRDFHIFSTSSLTKLFPPSGYERRVRKIETSFLARFLLQCVGMVLRSRLSSFTSNEKRDKEKWDIKWRSNVPSLLTSRVSDCIAGGERHSDVHAQRVKTPDEDTEERESTEEENLPGCQHHCQARQQRRPSDNNAGSAGLHTCTWE